MPTTNGKSLQWKLLKQLIFLTTSSTTALKPESNSETKRKKSQRAKLLGFHFEGDNRNRNILLLLASARETARRVG